MKKKLLSILLTICMVMTLLPALAGTASAVITVPTYAEQAEAMEKYGPDYFNSGEGFFFHLNQVGYYPTRSGADPDCKSCYFGWANGTIQIDGCQYYGCGFRVYWYGHCTNCSWSGWLNPDTCDVVYAGHGTIRDTITQAVSCTENGYKTSLCTRCGESFGTQSIPALGHEYPSGSHPCASDAPDAYICAHCKEVCPKPQHTYHSIDCTSTTTCEVCGETVAASGHVPSAAEPTCTRPVTCLRCNEVLEAATSHQYSFLLGGWPNGRYSSPCRLCGECIDTYDGLFLKNCVQDNTLNKFVFDVWCKAETAITPIVLELASKDIKISGGNGLTVTENGITATVNQNAGTLTITGTPEEITDTEFQLSQVVSSNPISERVMLRFHAASARDAMPGVNATPAALPAFTPKTGLDNSEFWSENALPAAVTLPTAGDGTGSYSVSLWTVKDAGTIGARVLSNGLLANAPGEATLTAWFIGADNGAALSQDFTVTFAGDACSSRTVTLSADQSHGTVAGLSIGANTIAYGGSVGLTFAPEAGYEAVIAITSTVDGSPNTAVKAARNAYDLPVIFEDYTLAVSFREISHTVTVADGIGGGSFAPGELVSIELPLPQHAEFFGFSIKDAETGEELNESLDYIVGNENTYKIAFIMPDCDLNIKAELADSSYQLGSASGLSITSATPYRSNLLQIGDVLDLHITASSGTVKTLHYYSSDNRVLALPSASAGSVTSNNMQISFNAVGAGTATIYLVDDTGTQTASIDVPVCSALVYPTAVTLSESELTLGSTGTARLTAAFSPANATYREIRWKSDAPWIAEVDAMGDIIVNPSQKVNGNQSGVANITATVWQGQNDPAAQATCIVTVDPTLDYVWDSAAGTVIIKTNLGSANWRFDQAFDTDESTSTFTPSYAGVENVIVEAGVTSVAPNAFNCANLANLTFQGDTPPAFETDGESSATPFTGANTSVKIHVPAGKADVYKAAVGADWADNVVADAITGVLDLSQGAVTITSTGYKQGDALEETPYVGSYVLTGSYSEASTPITVSSIGAGRTITLNGVTTSGNDGGYAIKAACGIDLIVTGNVSLSG